MQGCFCVTPFRPSNLGLFWSSSQTAARQKKGKRTKKIPHYVFGGRHPRRLWGRPRIGATSNGWSDAQLLGRRSTFGATFNVWSDVTLLPTLHSRSRHHAEWLAASPMRSGRLSFLYLSNSFHRLSSSSTVTLFGFIRKALLLDSREDS